MTIRKYLNSVNAPIDIFEFMDDCLAFKEKSKSLDGFAFDYNTDINSVKLYLKTYPSNLGALSNFIRKFSSNDEFERMYYSATSKLFRSKKQKSLNGLNFSLKYHLATRRLTKCIYFSTSNTSSLCISNNLKTRKYSYIYNKPLLRLINKSFGIPKNKEAIELSFRKNSVDATVYPKLHHKNIHLSKNYCQDLLLDLDSSNFFYQHSRLINNYNIGSTSFITKGYKFAGKQEKIYFGTFDWKNSAFL